MVDRVRLELSHHQIPLYGGASSQNARPSLLGLGTFLIAFTLHRFLISASSFDDGYKVPATEGPGGFNLGVERGHRSHGFREGALDCSAGQGRFWHRQHHPHNAQSGLLLIRVDRLQAEMHLGHDDRRRGLRRTWAGLR